MHYSRKILVAAIEYGGSSFGAIAAHAQDGCRSATRPSSTAPQDRAVPAEPQRHHGACSRMRHIKLWFAGHAGNWPLADYEIGELKRRF